MSQYNKPITLLDGSFAVYGQPIAAWESLAYSDAWDKHGTISLVAEMDYFADLSGASWMEIDGRVYEVETITSEDNDKTVKITGCSLNVLFDRIVITAKERLQGRLEERIAYLVNKYAVTGSQAVTGLTIGANMGYARAMDATTIQWQTLSEFLYTQLNQRGFSYKITHNGSGALQFSLIQALDRTQDQTVNPNVQLSTTAEIENASYKKSIKDFRNYAIVHDDDETNPQVVHVDLSNGAAKRVLPVSGRAVGADDSAATNLYVMVGQYTTGVGYIATSDDGQTWTNRVTSGYGAFWAADYQNGKFIVCGPGNAILTSVDGISWSVTNPGLAVSLEGALYDDGLYIVTGNSSKILTSYNSTTWIERNTGGTKIIDPTRTRNGFIAVGAGGYYYLSPDAMAWTPHQFIVSHGYFVGTGTSVVNGNITIAGYINDGGTYNIAYAQSLDDGDTFSFYEYSSPSNGRMLDMAYGLGVYVSVGQPNIIKWSDDGVSWNTCTPTGGTPDYITVTFDGTLFHAYSATTKHHAYSADGKNWTLTTFTTSAVLIDTVTYGTSSHSGNLYQVGVDALQASVVVEALDGDVNQELAPEYEIDYNIGDVIDTLDPVRNIAATKRVYSVDHIIDKDNDYTIVPKLGKDFLTLRQLIAKEIKNNGI